MRIIKLDNEPFDRNHIAIYDDFYRSKWGEWFIHNDTLTVCQGPNLVVVLSDAQEAVDKAIYEMMHNESGV